MQSIEVKIRAVVEIYIDMFNTIDISECIYFRSLCGSVSWANRQWWFRHNFDP